MNTSPLTPVSFGSSTGKVKFHSDRLLAQDPKILDAAIEISKHDLDVKFDWANMRYPAAWDIVSNASRWDREAEVQDILMAGLPQEAILVYNETKEAAYLAKADRILDWFMGYLQPETRMNHLRKGANIWGPKGTGAFIVALLNKYDRSHDPKYLDVAEDAAWINNMFLGTTSDTDTVFHKPMAGVTVVCCRGGNDFDCAPNLCFEKDNIFMDVLGPMLDHVGGPAWDKVVELYSLVLARDSWTDYFGRLDQSDTVLRTAYDTEMRVTANLIYSLNKSTDPKVVAVEKLVSKCDLNLDRQRDIYLANGTMQDRATTLKIRYLKPGTYDLVVDGASLGAKSHPELEQGIDFTLKANTHKSVAVKNLTLAPVPPPRLYSYDSSETYLTSGLRVDQYLNASGEMVECALRQTSRTMPKYLVDKSIDGTPISLNGTGYSKGIGVQASSAIFFDLNRQYKTFSATVGIDDAAGTNASVVFTVFVDGVLAFHSGVMTKSSAPKTVSVGVTNAQKLLLRVSSAWDHADTRGAFDVRDDKGDWADAKLTGRAIR